MLSVKLKNVPMDTSLVHSSTNDILNRVERLSECHIVLADNLGEENQLLFLKINPILKKKEDWT